MSDSNSVSDDSLSFDGHPIIEAIRRRDSNTLQQLIEKRPKMVGNLKRRALQFAASLPSIKCLQLLLEYSDNPIVNIDAQTLEEATVLHLAHLSADEKNFEIFLQKGGDPRVKLLETYSALFLAVRTNNLRIVETLLNHPGNSHPVDLQGRTLLHLSAGCGHLDISRILLEKGADPSSTDEKYQLPLHHAYQNKHFNCAHLLIRNNLTPINHQDKYGTTPLMLAAKSCDSEGAHMLLENGADVNIFDHHGITALHFVAWSGNSELLDFMLQFTDADYVEKFTLKIIPNLFDAECSLFSLTCCAIHSKNIECLKVLASSKLSKSFLQLPFVQLSRRVESPLAYIFWRFCEPNNENLNAFLLVLLEHKITMVHEFFKPSPADWPNGLKYFSDPFLFLMKSELSSSQKQYYLNLLITNDITIDYCLQCYNDNSQDFSSFTNYQKWYEPLWKAFVRKEFELMKLMMSSSAILEPDQVIIQFIEIPCYKTKNPWILTKDFPHLYRYLISLKPVYFKKQRWHSQPQYPYFSLKEEFSESSLQQLCRTVIRHHLRDYTLEGNLCNFKKNINALPLPTSLKNYLLFKCP